MSTSLLYHGFGLVGYRFVRQDFFEGHVVFRIEQPRERLRCSHCHSENVWSQGGIERSFHTLPIGSKPVQIQFKVPRLLCFDCGLVRQAQLGFADPKKRYTRSLERYVLELSRLMTIQDVAEHLQLSCDTIKDIQARWLQKRFGKPKLHKLKQIAIDEINIGKGHRYLTIVLDLRSGAVVFVGDGKGADALKPFWRRLRPSGAKIAAVAMDMSAAYRRAVATYLPKAKIVFDRFHVVKLFNDKLSDLRRALYHEATDVLHKEVLKGTRWLLLKNRENLDVAKDEKKRLEEALMLNRPLATAYYMKEDLRRFWEQPGKRFATLFLDSWIRRAEASGIKMLQQMAKTLAAHRSGLLAYYDVMITSGPMEGTNNKIKTMKRQAYGFRDREFFKLKILAIHETRYVLVG